MRLETSASASYSIFGTCGTRPMSSATCRERSNAWSVFRYQITEFRTEGRATGLSPAMAWLALQDSSERSEKEDMTAGTTWKFFRMTADLATLTRTLSGNFHHANMRSDRWMASIG